VKLSFPIPRLPAIGCSILSGLLYWLAFPGKDVWPLAFVAFLPLLLAMHGRTPKGALGMGFVAGLTMNLAGFSWLTTMLKTFSGFPLPLCLLFVVIICSYQGLRVGIMGWFYGRATQRGWNPVLVAFGAFVASEYLGAYLMLFPWYFGATMVKAPAFTQVADLGGPILIGLVVLAPGVAAFEILRARSEERAFDRRLVGGLFAVPVLGGLYGFVRIKQVDAAAQAAPPVHVGIVQGNLGLMQKREDSAEGLRRHVRMTNDLRKKGVELVVWSESSVTMGVSEDIYKSFYRNTVTNQLGGVPTIFGGVVIHEDPDPRLERLYNTAFISNKKGEIVGRYDKEYLLAFGEYLPLGDTFPILYEWSPNSGRFAKGTDKTLLPLEAADGTHHVAPLICYEDILPGFTNDMVAGTDAELLVNITNDAWFGDTAEPWEHLALATIRSVEHRRYLVRSTNSGVSAFVDPVGRVMLHTHTFKQESLDTIVHWMKGATVYEYVGEKPWALFSLAMVFFAFRRHPAKSKEDDAKSPPEAAKKASKKAKAKAPPTESKADAPVEPQEPE
jgi:apolipoprotein N-acyltransferase